MFIYFFNENGRIFNWGLYPIYLPITNCLMIYMKGMIREDECYNLSLVILKLMATFTLYKAVNFSKVRDKTLRSILYCCIYRIT